MTRNPIIDGSETTGNLTFRPVINPYDQSQVGEVSYADGAQMASAIVAARRAFEMFKRTDSHERSSILRSASETIVSRKAEIAKFITQESGKPITQSRTEVDRAAFTFRMASEAANHARDGRLIDLSSAPSGKGRTGSYRYFPIGVIAAITPFNFPLNLVAHKLAPAIAVGNSIVLKPAPQTPLTAFLLADILKDAGLPPGVLNVVPCENNAAEAMVRDERIAMVSFTGSAPVGWKLKSIAGQARVALELGGNGAVIVDDISDMDALIASLTTAAFSYAGQVCISLQTLHVKREHYDVVLSGLIEAAKNVVVGDPMSEKTVVGPMISEAATSKVEDWIAEAIELGAVRHTGVRTKPNVMTPTVLTNVPHDCALYVEEAFAPLVIVESYDAIEEVVQTINTSKYGLQAGLFTNNLTTVDYVYNELEVGGLIVNDTNAFRFDTMPYGGVKNSGFGREGIEFAMREMSEIKMLVVR